MSHQYTKSHFTWYATLVGAMLLMLCSSFADNAKAQPTRHVYLEEFTGTWCGYCPRGAYADDQLINKYGDSVVIVCIHGAFTPGTNEDPFQTAQGDSMLYGIGFPQAEGFSYPGGWTAREPVGTGGTTWNVDPTAWINPLPPFVTSTTPGVADTMVGTPALASVSISNVTFDVNTGMVSATVTGTFQKALSGDFRLNLMVTEDSITGPTGTPYTPQDYDQTNYYYHCDQLGNSSNPLYNLGSGTACDGEINGFVHRHVFREAVGGVHGVAGIIPSTVQVGKAYTTTFNFALPYTVINPNHVHLVAIVHQYSATDLNGNEVFDAKEVPLTTAPVAFAANELDVSADGGQYLVAHAMGDTTTTLTVSNNGTDAVTANFSPMASSLPAGWNMSFSPASVAVPAGGQITDTVKITAPEQSAYITPTILIAPHKAGEYIAGSSYQLAFLSDNTMYPAYSYGAENAAVFGMPDSMRIHTAYIPLNSSTISYYDPSALNWPVGLAMFLSDPILDGGEGNGVASALPSILGLMSEGKPIYISSDDAMAWAFVGNANTETDAVQSFFLDSLGITWRSNKSRISNNQYVPFTISGTTDPIAAGMTGLSANSTGSLAGDGETPLFNVPAGSPSTSLFYVDGTKASNVSLKAELPSGVRIVYMGFALNALSNQVKADTIFRRSIEWLLSTNPAAVNPQPGIAHSGITVSPNPFHGLTHVSYTAAPGEKDVTLAAYDLLGRQVVNLHAEGSGNTYTAAFDGSKLPEGTYIIMAHSSRGTQQIKVVNQE